MTRDRSGEIMHATRCCMNVCDEKCSCVAVDERWGEVHTQGKHDGQLSSSFCHGYTIITSLLCTLIHLSVLLPSFYL